MPDSGRERIEIALLLSGIKDRYGYDFTNYSPASLKRRLDLALLHSGLKRFTELLDLVFRDERAFDSFLGYLSISVTEMFRDPLFYRAIREKVVPILKTYPFVKIWHAGCATGEEVYSMAILLQEENFLHRARIYATDYNREAIRTAEQGFYQIKNLEKYRENYVGSGGKGHLSSYFQSAHEWIKIHDQLKRNITFAYHNLVTDGVFGEMNVILCRNVLIYFDKTLQARVHSLFSDSLRQHGFLCLGSKESLRFSAVQSLFSDVDAKQKIYCKRG